MLEKGNFINNRYEIIGRVGAGGMSDVYKAKDHKLNRNVAMKVLKQEYSKDKNFVSKFRVEAQSAASLIHPNIVNVYDVGEDDGLYYIVMELIEGITLKHYIEKKEKLTYRETIRRQSVLLFRLLMVLNVPTTIRLFIVILNLKIL